MKNTIVLLTIIFSFVGSIAFAQNSRPETKLTYLTKEIFFSKMDGSSNELHVLYSYGYWCKECVVTLPKLMSLLESYTQVALYPLIVDKQDSTAIKRNLVGLSKVKNFQEAYLPDNSYDRKYYKQYKKFHFALQFC